VISHRICATFCIQPIYTQLSAFCIGIYLRSSCLFRCRYQPKCHSFYNRCAHSGCLSWLSFIKVIFQLPKVKLAGWQVVRKSYCIHVAHCYCIKLQHQGYTERWTDIIGTSVSEPQTSVFKCDFSYSIYLLTRVSVQYRKLMHEWHGIFTSHRRVKIPCPRVQ